MRTKVLLCAAALAASLATSMAQNVYSLNVVGYYNVTVPQNGLVLMANQLNTTNNDVSYIIPTAPDYTTVYVYNGGYGSVQYVGTDNFGNGWSAPQLLNPGMAFFYQDPGTPGGQTLTFVGTVLQGSLSNNLVLNGLTFAANMVPVAATLGAMNLPAEDYDNVYLYNAGWSSSQYVGSDNFGSGWSGGIEDGNGPVINVGEGFSYQKSPGNVDHAWVQNFTVQ